MKRQLNDFFFKPARALPLGLLRILVSATLLLQAFLMRSYVFEMFSSSGFIQGPVSQSLGGGRFPQISNFLSLFGPMGLTEMTCIWLVVIFYCISLFFLIIGFQTRAAAIGAWLLHWILMNTADTTTYGVDLFSHVFLFYFIWFPVGAAWSVDEWLKGRTDESSPWARLGLRIMQLHLCIMYLTSGLDKAQGPQWWNGELLWRAMNMPVYSQYNMSWLAYWPSLSMIAGWSTLVLEIGYCIFIWPKATRRLWVFGIVSLHVGIMIFLGLHLFGLIMAVLTACLFGISADRTVTSERLVLE